MAGISAERFEQNVRKACEQSEIVVRIAILSESSHHIRLRVFLTVRSLLDIYYNQTTQKTAFAHIQKARRIFGADNTNGFWHWHPVEDPEKHVPADKEIAFGEFLRCVEENLVKHENDLDC
ncbi:MAG: hypothetical protein Q7U34_15830 [Anaerolineales bacterium]|nr:hypothetical protein [Anaerolineales bacterium]MDP3186623.1 hypothetical protein [Anaerolineales bacterium]